jgi:hypothetical protein
VRFVARSANAAAAATASLWKHVCKLTLLRSEFNTHEASSAAKSKKFAMFEPLWTARLKRCVAAHYIALAIHYLHILQHT